jgi:hypothetical protein
MDPRLANASANVADLAEAIRLVGFALLQHSDDLDREPDKKKQKPKG